MYLSSDIRAKAFCPNMSLQIGVSVVVSRDDISSAGLGFIPDLFKV